MKAVYSDCEGCTFELTQQGQPVINLFFNHNELDDPTRVPGISRKISSEHIPIICFLIIAVSAFIPIVYEKDLMSFITFIVYKY